MHEIYIGTILLELNRWANPKTPSYLVSDWTPRCQEAGFDGMELWEYHATKCPPAELITLGASGFPVSVFNTYCGFDDDSESDREIAARMVTRFGSAGVKFNVGGDISCWDTYLRNVDSWRSSLPESCQILCECHGGTVLETPEEALRFFDALGGNWGIIVHCFAASLGILRQWFELLGSKIAHAHVALRDEDGKMIRLDRQPRHVRESLHIMREEGFQGSFTLEFTEGTRAHDENMEDLWQAALADLDFLRDSFT